MITKIRVSILVLLLFAISLLAHATETENYSLQILPAPGEVTVDGKVTDWDLTGSIFACGDVENHRDKFGVWFSAMYDAKNLYVAREVTDQTPWRNGATGPAMLYLSGLLGESDMSSYR